MLSKIKASAASMAAEQRASAAMSISSETPSDNEQEDSELATSITAEHNDANNNDSSPNNNNNNSPKSQAVSSGKKNQEQLLDIVEVSRKRRLSKDSADSLDGFIRWSFSHLDSNQQPASALQELAEAALLSQKHQLNQLKRRRGVSDELEMDESPDHQDWPAYLANSEIQQLSNKYRQQLSEQPMRQHGKLSAGSSTTNLSLIMNNNNNNNERNQHSKFNAAEESEGPGMNAAKRARSQMYSPDLGVKLLSQVANNQHKHKRNSSSYLNNVVERLHQQQQQQQLVEQRNQRLQEIDHQNDQVGQIGGNGLSMHLQQFLQQQSSLEDLCSAVGLDESNQLVFAAAIHRALVDSAGGAASQLGAAAAAAGDALVDTKSSASSTGSNSSSGGGNSTLAGRLGDSPRRFYNTRASSGHPQLASHMPSTRTVPRGPAASGSSGSMAPSLALHHQLANQHSLGLAAAAANSMVDFKCDTCLSSFDDRHRLMQHQSIHLELKKDWFTETPVDEVMKIFNRRRGEFLCNICNLRFEATLDYDQHNHQVHGARPYCCQFCGNGTRTFKFWRQYLNHLYDHRYVFSCTIDDCDFTVNRRDSLRFHIFRFHLNCQLPQNQTQQLRGSNNNNNNLDNLMGGSNNPDSKWPMMEDEEEDSEDEMNIAD